MPSVLRNILALTGLVQDVPTPTPHGLKLNGVAAIPKFVAATGGGYTITADATNVTVTRLVGSAAAVSVYVEYWHSFDDAQPLPGGINTALFPFVVQSGTAAGNMSGAGTTNTIAKFTGANILGDSQITDDGTSVTVNGGGFFVDSAEVRMDSATTMAFETAAGAMQLTAAGDMAIYGTTEVDITSDTRVVIFGGTAGITIGANVGEKIGFYNTTPIIRQTGVAVSAAGVHAALVNLGLITA